MTATKLDLVKVEDWGLFTDTTKPIIIAGPCSAESEQQVFETAKGLKAAGVEVLRAGIWKPRTRPNCFEGVGSEGLVWMKRVQRELGMKISTEVANVKHVYEALKAGVDMLWIGARTSANPFAMQEIADALKGTDIPVLVKKSCQSGCRTLDRCFGTLKYGRTEKNRCDSSGFFCLCKIQVPQCSSVAITYRDKTAFSRYVDDL